MKKTLLCLISVLLCFALTACSAGAEASSVGGSASVAVSSDEASNEPSSSEEASSAPSSSAASSSEESSSASSAGSSSAVSSSNGSADSSLSNPENPNRPQTPPLDPPSSPDGMLDPVTVTYTPKRDCGKTTYTGLPSLDPVSYIVNDPTNSKKLSTTASGFSYGVGKNGKPSSTTVDNQSRFDSYKQNVLAWDSKTEEKVLYLTFDCGYPYKDCVSKMLDTLKKKNVPAAFFCTIQFVREAPAETARMIKEGHIVGNHTANHPAFPNISREKMAKELLAVDNYLRVNYGYENKYFRYPSGTYSRDTVDLVYSLGYRTAFWSVAYVDWDPEDQRTESEALATLKARIHPGAVVLLHSTSPTNVKILERFIDECLSQGYTFRSLDEYEHWDK